MAATSHPDAPLLLLTRPPTDARSAARWLAAHGVATLCMPLQYTRRAPLTAALAADLRWAGEADIHVFVSRAAVAAAQTLAAQTLAHAQQRVAVGRATAAALTQLGLTAKCAPSGSEDSEGSLELPELQQVAGRRIALWLAPGGREHLAEQLARRGALVRSVAVYRRVDLAPRPAALATLREHADRLVLSATSALLLRRLHAVLEDANLSALRHQPLIVASARIAKTAAALGFARVLVAAGASAAAFADALKLYLADLHNPQVMPADMPADSSS